MNNICTFEEHLRVDIELYRTCIKDERLIKDAEALLEMSVQGKLESYKGQYVVIKDGKIVKNGFDAKSLCLHELGPCYLRQIVDTVPIQMRY